jgi:6-phosphogluconolactonase
VLQIFDDRDALAQGAAALFAELAHNAVADHDRFTVLLAGGETPRLTYQALAQEPYRSTVPWDKVHVFWGDERCVPEDDPRSNALMARQALLDHVAVRAENIHPIRSNGLPQQVADAYGVELAEYFGWEAPCFDLVLLGLGDDGHTLSLLPGSAALKEHLRWTAVAKRPEEDFSRVTLTAPIVNQAATILFLVAGSGKAQVLPHVLEDADPPYPAQLIQPDSGDLRWFVDRDAAQEISEQND